MITQEAVGVAMADRAHPILINLVVAWTVTVEGRGMV